jgi:sulfur carrier protein ThiS
MYVTVQLHTVLRNKLEASNKRTFEHKLPENSRVAELLHSLKIDLPEEALLIVINGKIASFETILKDGDKIDIIPAIAGGEE